MRRLITCLPPGIHNNPVEEEYVFKPEDYLYSSATDYAGEKGLLDNVIVVHTDKSVIPEISSTTG